MAEKRTFTEKQVLDLLDKQRKACAESITADHITGFNAKRLVLNTDPVEF